MNENLMQVWENCLQFMKDNCEIKVVDHGEGIAPDEIVKIFDPFYTTKELGNGLGLLITYRILKDHGGSISVKSKPGEGTTFILSIPVRRKAVQELPSSVEERKNSEETFRILSWLRSGSKTIRKIRISHKIF